ncbi:hypothetical protein SDC9_177847 [bioreactor metagenome]|uniref:Uncharacterized protein n=1 Tax=bioreactor metagenome TaxID=1076179 RepID=A0A645GVT7_9ZZZZ
MRQVRSNIVILFYKSLVDGIVRVSPGIGRGNECDKTVFRSVVSGFRVFHGSHCLEKFRQPVCLGAGGSVRGFGKV